MERSANDCHQSTENGFKKMLVGLSILSKNVEFERCEQKISNVRV